MIRPAAGIDRDIDKLDEEIGKVRERIAALRRERAPEPVEDYEVTTSNGATVRLSALFQEKRELLLVHNMGRKCPMCTTWADGFNGLRVHLEARAAFVVSSPDAPEVQREFAASRGWGFRMVSVAGSALPKDLGFAGEPTQYYPGMSVLRRLDDSRIVRVAKTGFGPGDDFCPLFHVLALFPEGQDGWWPKLAYDGDAGN